MAKEKNKKWMRPCDVKTFRTSDPKEMLYSYLPKPIIKEWTEDFLDEDTKDIIPIERTQLLVEPGCITQEKLQEIMFNIQAGEIEEVEISKENILEMDAAGYGSVAPYSLKMSHQSMESHYVVLAKNIPQAITIATEFGQMYKNMGGVVTISKTMVADIDIIPGDHQCIPEDDRTPAYEDKSYFKVDVRTEYLEGLKLKHFDTHYVIVAKEVGEAKERIALYMDILKAQRERDGIKDENGTTRTIRKAVPFEVDCIVPLEYSQIFFNDSNKK